VNAILAVPLELRLALVALAGLALGSVINWAIYSLAWFARPISPWQQPHPDAPPRRWSDFLPVIGWFGLAREAKLHGRGFWIRPLVLELACGVGLAALYHWGITEHLAPPIPAPGGVIRASALVLHQQFLSHMILFALLLAATFIDFDEKTIPDEITIPGALAGLLLAALWPDSLLPVLRPVAPGIAVYAPLLLTDPDSWIPWLNTWRGAAVGIGIFVGWCVALVPATCTLRRGWLKAVQYYLASVARESAWWKMLILAALGSTLILAVWSLGGPRWQALLSSLAGLAFGGLLIWAVRIVGWVALHKEAMGFGDVTLMAMIGAFLGWQPSLILFFLSPFAALVIALTQWVLTGRRDIAFGPYLCLAAAFVVIRWPHIWSAAGLLFGIGWLLPALLAVSLVLMLGLLMLWRIIEQALFHR
jgi:leader peptidase (prepilin peptidase)/N-methyltransferase